MRKVGFILELSVNKEYSLDQVKIFRKTDKLHEKK